MRTGDGLASLDQMGMPHPDKPLNVVFDSAAVLAQRPQPRWASQRLRRAEILAATRRMIAENSTRNVTMRMIASAADVSIPTIHNLIGARNDVIVRAINDHTSSLARYAATSMSSENFLVSHAESYWRTAMVAPDFLRSISLGYSTDRSLHEFWLKHGVAVVEHGLRHRSMAGFLSKRVDISHLAMRTSMLISATVHEWAIGSLDTERLRTELAFVAECILWDATRPGNNHRHFGGSLQS